MDPRIPSLSRRGFVALSLSLASSRLALGGTRDRPRSSLGGATTRCSVRPALAAQGDLIEKKEHCSLDRGLLDSLKIGVGQQVRVYRGEDEFALFTVTEARESSAGSSVRMGHVGRARLDGPAEFEATVVARAPHPTLSDAEAKAAGEFVERLDGDEKAARLVAMAPHGGGIEPHTDQQAERLAAKFSGKGVASWRCKGWHPKGSAQAFERWHITSTETNEASFPLLARLGEHRFDHAVSFHGMANPGLLIGGGGPPALKRSIRDELVRALEGSGLDVKIAGDGQALGGSSPRNIVNRVCKGNGIQVEQSSLARREHWQAIADAVAKVYETLL